MAKGKSASESLTRPTSEEFPTSDFDTIANKLGLENDAVKFVLDRAEDSSTHTLTGTPRDAEV